MNIFIYLNMIYMYLNINIYIYYIYISTYLYYWLASFKNWGEVLKEGLPMVGGPAMRYMDISFPWKHGSNVYPGKRLGVWWGSKVSIKKASSLDPIRCSNSIPFPCLEGSKLRRCVRVANRLIRRIIYVPLGLFRGDAVILIQPSRPIRYIQIEVWVLAPTRCALCHRKSNEHIIVDLPSDGGHVKSCCPLYPI